MKTLLLCVAVIFAMSCQKGISTEMPDINTPKLPVTPVTGSVAGLIVDENKQPVAGAQVNIGTSIYLTDANGFFSTPSITLDKYITTVKVSVPGYFTAYRSFSANQAKNYVTIKMIPKLLTGSFSSNATGSVLLSNGSSINFLANSVKDKTTGAPYSGTVNVYAAYIDPTNSDFGTIIPGSMMAEDAQSSYTLRSAGMMAVELESDAGVPLQLENSKPATMRIAIPSTLVGIAPGTIDTWSLDGRGVWIKEGSATKVGSSYEFRVTHFSFWNVDVPMSAVYLTINAKDQNGNILANKWVRLSSTTTFGQTWGHTDDQGNVSGMVPKDELLTIDVYGDWNCFSAIYSQNIGPFATSSSLNVIATLNPASTFTLNGMVNDCAGNPVTDGFVIIYSGAFRTWVSVSNGSFSLALTICTPPASLHLIAVNTAGGQQSSIVTVPVTGSIINAGTISACGTSLNEFITYIVDGTTFNISGPNTITSLYAYTSGTTTSISCYSGSMNEYITFDVQGTSTGTFPVYSDSLRVNNFVGVIASPGASTTFTSFGGMGEFIEGTFDIPFSGSGAVHTLTGSFRLRRD